MVVTPARRSCAVIGSSQISIDPQGRQRKSSEPQRMSWRAGMQGREPVTCEVNRTALGGERIEVGRLELGAAVAPEHVPVQAVEQQHHQVARGCVGRHRPMVGRPFTAARGRRATCRYRPRPGHRRAGAGPAGSARRSAARASMADSSASSDGADTVR